jgi:hypothetical protein
MYLGKPKINFYKWSVEDEIAIVYAEKLDEGREFTIERDGILYELGVSRVINDASDSTRQDIGEDYEIGVASVISKRKTDYLDFS